MTQLVTRSAAPGLLYHTIRNADGTWLSSYDPVEDVVGGGPPAFSFEDCAGIGGALHLVGVGTDYRLYHTIRNPDGSWQPTFGLIEDVASGGPTTGFGQVACAGTGTTLHVVGHGRDANLYHTLRLADGTWQNAFALIEAEVEGGPPAGDFNWVACAGVGDELHVVGVGIDGQLYHTIRHADGTWQPSFGPVASAVSGQPQGFGSLACSGTGGVLQLAVLGDGQLYHAIRNADGSWQPFFGAIASLVQGGPATFGGVACAGTGEILQVVGLGTDGLLYHTLRRSDGTWQDAFGPVDDEVQGDPGGFFSVAAAGIVDALHLVGSA